MIRMTSQHAILHLLDTLGHNYNSLAKLITDKSDKYVQATQIRNYAKNYHCMNEDLAEVIYKLFKIEIVDAHRAKGRPPII